MNRKQGEGAKDEKQYSSKLNRHRTSGGAGHQTKN